MGRKDPAGHGVPSWLFNGLAVLVAGVWATSFLVDAFGPASYGVDPAVHGAMLIVLGAVFGWRIVKGGGEE